MARQQGKDRCNDPRAAAAAAYGETATSTAAAAAATTLTSVRIRMKISDATTPLTCVPQQKCCRMLPHTRKQPPSTCDRCLYSHRMRTRCAHFDTRAFFAGVPSAIASIARFNVTGTSAFLVFNFLASATRSAPSKSTITRTWAMTAT